MLYFRFTQEKKDSDNYRCINDSALDNSVEFF